ncbi:MAG TPA: serine/threonine-protein kinase, partial [Planctomycetota bacterium]|nr:serine/threonine-protein kinase [Planctomycetota bacterium]
MTASPVTASSGAAFADVARSLGNPRREELRLDVGERIRDFTILECLGLGGFGNVYRVRRDGADKEIALKILRPGARVPERFEREIDILTTTRHSSIVVVFERGEAEVPTDGGLRRVRYFTMELVRRTLHASIQDTTAEERSKLEYVKAVAERMAGVADALAHLHDKNVFHRDINPSNVGECEGCYKLFDFGLAKARDDREVRTLTDHVLGTLPYIPPEQFSGSRTELFAQLDLYCLTATLYEVVTGRPP